MAAETGIGWTDGTVNFVIGCTPIGPGCDGCYAAAFAKKKMNIEFRPGGIRHVTKSGFDDPLRWQRMHDRGQHTMRKDGREIPVPKWVFACSLSDFFDNEWPEGLRERAWDVIGATPALRWQIVTKRVGNVLRMLPPNWSYQYGFYRHVGIVATMVNQEEVDRDMPKLVALKDAGVRWIGVSIEPQIGRIVLGPWLQYLDWVITGGESKQDGHSPRPYELTWASDIIGECQPANVPVFVKQLGDKPVLSGNPVSTKGKGVDIAHWPESIRVRQMPRIYDNDPIYVPRLVKPRAEAFPELL